MKTKSLKLNFIMNAILTMSQFIFPLITFPYISRILLPAGTGKVSFATSVISYFALFAMVILGHAVIRYPINLHEVAWTKAIYDWVETMHMPLFFMVSGFCYRYTGNYRIYINKKIQRILIPYVIFNLIDCVPRALLGILVNRPRPIGESIVSMLLYGGEYWFLYVLMSIFLVFPLIEKVTANRIILLS